MSGGACPAQLPICCVTLGKPLSLSGLQQNKRTQVFFFPQAEFSLRSRGNTSWRVIYPVYNFHSWPSIASFHPHKSTRAKPALHQLDSLQEKLRLQGPPVRTRREAGAPLLPPRGNEALRTSPPSGVGVPVLSQPRNNTAQVLPQILPPRGGWQRSPTGPSLHPSFCGIQPLEKLL